MSRIREAALVIAMGACGSLLFHAPAQAGPQTPQTATQSAPAQPAQPPAAPAQTEESAPGAQQAAPAPVDQAAATPEAASAPGKLIVTVGKSLIIDSPVNIKRVHVANGQLAEAVAVNPQEVLINGTSPGETSLIVWQQNGNRLVYDLTVRMSSNRLDAVRQQVARDFPNDDINITYENDTAFVRGKVKDVLAADRIVAIVSTLGKTVNLLRVEVPPVESQVMLKVRFANVDRSAGMQLGLNIWNASFNQQTSLGTGPALFPDNNGRIPVPQSVNLLFVRPDLNLVAELQALQTKNLLEMLAEPNLLAISGEQASFLAGGEFPFPTVQPSASGASAITIMWREYGVRLNFLPVVTPRNTIRLRVAPEVSSLDYTNAVTIQGFTVPGLSSRRVQTDVELESGQTFVIAGLLDNQVTDQLQKVPGISAIPVLGKLFQSKSVNKSNSELLVIITPELVRPIPAGQPVPELQFKSPFLPSNSNVAPHHPSMDKTGPVPVHPPVDSLPYERLAQPPRQGQTQSPATAVPTPNTPPPANPPDAAPNSYKPSSGGASGSGK